MLGEQAQPAESDGARNRATSGPRHAAPRKSLLTKLHVPAGKAVALAAMPTAVLMGMGFTPHLAQADEPKNPFKGGSCVSQPDGTAPSATPAAGKDAATGGATDKATPKPSASPSATKPAAPSASATPKPEPTATTAPAAPKSGTTTASPKPGTSPSPSPTPTPTKSTNPLDPLGLGNLLGGLLGTNSTSTPTPAPTTQSPTPAPTTKAPAPSTGPTPATPKPSSGGSGTSASGTSGSSTGKKTVTDTAKGATDGVKKTVQGLAGTTASPAPSATAKDGTVALDGSQGYPCPTYDAKALAAAKVEGGIPLLPDNPWTLKATKLKLHGLQYDGIVQVRTWSGNVKDVLKFTATGIDIDDLWQIVDGPNNTHTYVKARAGSTSTFSNGTVTLYTESLSGNLLGLIPVTFTPKAPPPLTLPELFFTNVTVVNAAQFGGDLHVPGMQVLPNQP